MLKDNQSTPRAGRSSIFTINFVLGTLASALGPLITVAVFIAHGDVWTLPTLRNVFLIGMGLELLSGASLFFFRDDKTLREAEDADSDDDGDASEPSAAEVKPPAYLQLPHVWLVPYLLFASSLLFCIGSGMTIKFVPLFFKNACGLSPTGVQLAMAGGRERRGTCAWPTARPYLHGRMPRV